MFSSRPPRSSSFEVDVPTHQSYDGPNRGRGQYYPSYNRPSDWAVERRVRERPGSRPYVVRRFIQRHPKYFKRRPLAQSHNTPLSFPSTPISRLRQRNRAVSSQVVKYRRNARKRRVGKANKKSRSRRLGETYTVEVIEDCQERTSS